LWFKEILLVFWGMGIFQNASSSIGTREFSPEGLCWSPDEPKAFDDWLVGFRDSESGYWKPGTVYGEIAERISNPKEGLVLNMEVDEWMQDTSIRGIAQTPDGYLWLATSNGLGRFDGVNITMFSAENTPGCSRTM